MTALSRDELLDAMRATVDEAYLDPLETEDDGQGFDLYQAIATMLARASEAVEVSTQAMYAQPHSSQTSPPGAGGAQATGTLLVTRSAPTDGDITLEAGEPFLVMAFGPDGNLVTEAEIEVATDTLFAEGSSAPVAVPVIATRVGYHANLPASESRVIVARQRTTKTLTSMTTVAPNLVTDSGSGDTFDAGDAGGWLRFTAGPNVGTGPRLIAGVNESTDTATVTGAALVAGAGNNDGEVVDLERLGFVATISVDLSGGASPMLDAQGDERSIGRGEGETDTEYRARIRDLPDTICYNALYRAASRILTPLGLEFRVIESRKPADIVGAAWGQFAYDDPATWNWLLGRDHFFWQGDGFEYRGFYLVVERQWYGDFGAPFDQHPGGVHPSDAWDWMFYDGYPLGWYNDMERAIAEVEKARAAGVPWLVVIVDDIP